MDAPVEQKPKVPKFEVPPPEEFFENTQKLLSVFGLCKEVFYSPPSLKSLCEMLVKGSKDYPGDREEHLQVLDELVRLFTSAPQTENVIKGTASGEPKAVEQALHILLGALFHRTYRIMYPEFGTRQYVGNFFKMYIAPKVMKIPKLSRLESEVIYPAFGIKKLEEIDALSVVNWCKALYNYMEKDHNILKFHYRKEQNFFGYLDDIITAHQPKADLITRQIDQFKFLQSVCHSISTMWVSLSKLVPLLNGALFDKESPIQIQEIATIFQTKQIPPLLQKQFFYLVKSNYVERHMTCWEDFEYHLSIWLDMQCSYALYGVYYVLYVKAPSEGFSTAFQTVLLQGLNFNSPEQMAPRQTLDAIQTLSQFYLAFITDEKEVDWKFYNSKGTLKTFAGDCQAVRTKLMEACASANAPSNVGSTPAGLFY